MINDYNKMTDASANHVQKFRLITAAFNNLNHHLKLDFKMWLQWKRNLQVYEVMELLPHQHADSIKEIEETFVLIRVSFDRGVWSYRDGEIIKMCKTMRGSWNNALESDERYPLCEEVRKEMTKIDKIVDEYADIIHEIIDADEPTPNHDHSDTWRSDNIHDHILLVCLADAMDCVTYIYVGARVIETEISGDKEDVDYIIRTMNKHVKDLNYSERSMVGVVIDAYGNKKSESYDEVWDMALIRERGYYEGSEYDETL